MGYELQAKVVPPIEPTLLQKAIKEKFVSLQWTIVRPQENFFSIAVAGRAGSSWDEDYVIGVGRTIEQAVGRANTSEPDAAKEAETFIYLLDHNGSNLNLWEITCLIDSVVNQMGASAVWEEL